MKRGRPVAAMSRRLGGRQFRHEEIRVVPDSDARAVGGAAPQQQARVLAHLIDQGAQYRVRQSSASPSVEVAEQLGSAPLDPFSGLLSASSPIRSCAMLSMVCTNSGSTKRFNFTQPCS